MQPRFFSVTQVITFIMPRACQDAASCLHFHALGPRMFPSERSVKRVPHHVSASQVALEWAAWRLQGSIRADDSIDSLCAELQQADPVPRSLGMPMSGGWQLILPQP